MKSASSRFFAFCAALGFALALDGAARAQEAGRLRNPEFKCTTFQAYHHQDEIEITRRVLDEMASLRPAMLRIEFIADSDTTRTINYAAYDWIVEELGRRGIGVLGLIDYQSVGGAREAEWATEGFRQRFAARAREIAAHYRAHTFPIRHWEIWNEPDIKVEGFNVRIEPAPYARLLIAAWEAVKSADPGAVVVLGGLSPKGFAYKENYLEDLYASAPLQEFHAAKGFYPFDVVACHPYPEVYKDPDPGMAKLVNERIKAVMNRHGDRHKKVWITEMGWATCNSHKACVTEAQQAEFLRKSFLLMENLRDSAYPDDPPYIERYFWFKYDSFSPNDEWGLTPRNRARRKPSWFTFRDLTEPGPEAPPAAWVERGGAVVWGGRSDADLAARVAADDLAAGMAPALLEGALQGRPDEAQTARALAALTDGRFGRADSDGVCAADYRAPAMRLLFEFPAPVDIEEIRIFAGHAEAVGERAFQSHSLILNGAAVARELNTAPYGQAAPEDAKSAVSLVTWKPEPDETAAARGVKTLEIVTWPVTSFNYDFRDRWSPVRDPERDTDGAGPASLAPVLREIDVIGRLSAAPSAE